MDYIKNVGSGRQAELASDEVEHANGWKFTASLVNRIKGHAAYTDADGKDPGTTTLWKYRALYLDGDQPFGQWSDTVQIAVQG